jgi:hypothetical protein
MIGCKLIDYIFCETVWIILCRTTGGREEEEELIPYVLPVLNYLKIKNSKTHNALCSFY